ncbi:unnamed protein product [Symbiodinium sp. CCMP2592]|nr:unnamed protein product [Symbiodinium sp. CCMP2592]
MASPDVSRVLQFCEELAAAGVSRKDALEAVARAWPAAAEDSRSRRSVCIRVHEAVFDVEHEERLKERSDYFRMVLDGPFRDSLDCVVDVSELLQTNKRFSAGGTIEEWAQSMKQFLDVAEACDAEAAQALVRKQGDVCGCLRLLLLADCLTAPSIEQICADEACQRMQHEVLHDPKPVRDALICALPWELTERLLAGIQSMTLVLNLVGLWSRPATEAQERLRTFLQSRCAGIADNLDWVQVWLPLCQHHPHLLHNLPQTRETFERMEHFLANLPLNVHHLLDDSLPELVRYHSGHYKCGSAAGWSCCQQVKKRSPGCEVEVQPRVTIPISTISGKYDMILQRAIQQVIDARITSFVDHLEKHLMLST